ncbi:ribonuclease Z, mitochondrial-like [Penaeus japonicus]|uniref:ribonuclease Z, mitochondrial-like n=1 Tax=Penaeus japonicus TaxID=27405 RepID=UPI001C713F3D|nr:ribonuclease Z, mitochondrial-like [Penaeus japonicus]
MSITIASAAFGQRTKYLLMSARACNQINRLNPSATSSSGAREPSFASPLGPRNVHRCSFLQSSGGVEAKNKVLELLKKMPKKVDVKELQELRLARRQKVRKYPPSTVYLQVLGSGAPGAPRSLYVFTEQARYLFNCGEGSQRLAYEHRVKLSMMEHILITHKSWSNVGGLPGILLTLQDTGVPEISLHGPPGIESLYYDTRHFIRFRDLNIKYKHYKENEGMIGETNDPLSIQAVPIWAKKVESPAEDSEESVDNAANEDVEDLYAHEKPWAKKRNYPNTNANPMRKRQNQEESKLCKDLTIAYVCRPPPKAGALLLEKCVKAGITPGPLLGELKRGKDVTLEDGRVVLAADVTAPDDPGPVFIVIEIPTEAYLDSLLECPAFTQYQPSGATDSDLAEVVVHFTPSHVMASPRYQEWMSRFSPSTNHIIANDASSCMGSEAVHRLQYKLNHLSDDLFPLLQDKSIPIQKETADNTAENVDFDNEGKSLEKENVGSLESNSSTQYIVGPAHQAHTLLTYHIRPKKKIDSSNRLALKPEVYIKECYEEEKFESALLSAKAKLESSSPEDLQEESASQNYPDVIFLGTGSCIPNKTRNTSGILINISDDKCLLMDCGEGTYGQLVRLLGLSEADKALRNLAAVYVSHLHADHHIGFINILLGRRKAFHRAGITKIPKLALLAPQKILAYLISYHANFEPVLQDFSLIANHKLLAQNFALEKDLYEDLCSQLDMKRIDMTYVIHCPNSFGVAWTHVDGWKLVYSGDTMPCSGLVEIGQNCNLLIHEATMEDELEEDARIKTHSTTSQAIQVGRDMNAENILLTHFSQRYAKVPLFEDDLPDKVGIAFDNMRVAFKNLPKLRHLYGALVAMFAEDYDEMLEKTAKKRAARENLRLQLEELSNKEQVPGTKRAKQEQSSAL